MKKHWLVSALLLFSIIAQAQKKVLYFKLMDEISPKSWRFTHKALERAKSQHADAVIIELNTYGGLLDNADSIRSAILDAPMPVYVFINKNAASAGALISLACDSIYMHPGSTIGAASVVNQSGELLPDKYQSYMRGIMRSTATRNHRRPEIAEAMVDGNIVVDSINKKGQVITFTSEEAVTYGYCEAIVNTVDEVLARTGLTGAELLVFEPTTLDAFLGWLQAPFMSGLLILLILGGIYFEFQHPGAFFPIGVSIVAALLYFAPNYLDGLASNWEIILFLTGLLLLLLEIFVVPGFGVTGISGIVMLIASLVLAVIKNNLFNFDDVGNEALNRALATVSISFVVFIVLALVASRFMESNNFLTKIANTHTLAESKVERGIVRGVQVLQKNGVAITDLKPQGKVEVEGVIYNAISESGYIDAHSSIVVYRENGMMLFVKKV